MRVSLVVALGGFVLMLAVSSCSSNTGSDGADASREGPMSSASTGATMSADGSSADLSGDGASDDTQTDWVLPLDAAVEDLTGYSENAVVTAINDARFDYIVACMTEQGWEFDLSDLPPAAMTEEEQQTMTVTGQAAYYLTLLDDAPPGGQPEPGTGVTVAQSGNQYNAPGFQEDKHECWRQAEIEFPDPFDSLWPWLAEALEDLNHNVSQDERYVSAQADARACIAAEGYDFRTSEEGFNHFYDLASAVWDRYQNGDTDMDTTRSELQDLSVEESAFTETVFACSKEVGRVGHLVRTEYEEQFLADNGDRVALAAAEYAEKLEPFREFLLARKEG